MQIPHAQVENWTDCPPKPNCITVNVGDPLQFWSDGLLKSNYHRVRMPKEGEPLVCVSPVSQHSALPNTATLLAWQADVHRIMADDSFCCIWLQHFQFLSTARIPLRTLLAPCFSKKGFCAYRMHATPSAGLCGPRMMSSSRVLPRSTLPLP